MAWGPSTPSGNKWVTNKSCTFTATSSGLYGYSSVQYQIENNGWNPSVYSSGSTSIVVNLQNESPTGNSRWRVQFYKWDGVDSYGNPYGYGWTGWSGWAYFGVDSVKPTVPNRISPANDAYVKCSASSPLVLDWSDSSDAMSGFKQYKLDVNGSGLYYPTASQQSFTSMSEGWHNWYVYSRDNCFGVAFDSSTSWESNASAGVWRFYVDNTPPTPGVKRKPNYDASAGATVPWGTIVAVNPYAPVAEVGFAGNNDNPRVNGIVTGAGIPELV
ncbi:MAG TPA: hypothetical protein PKW98_17540, partial [Candidatus Wallbacteria bacterium]|nr:hypothetical protein [Candidatus Wallbacteria bacterium]